MEPLIACTMVCTYCDMYIEGVSILYFYVNYAQNVIHVCSL